MIVGKGYDITQIICMSRFSSYNIVIIYIDKNYLHLVTWETGISQQFAKKKKKKKPVYNLSLAFWIFPPNYVLCDTVQQPICNDTFHLAWIQGK